MRCYNTCNAVSLECNVWDATVWATCHRCLQHMGFDVRHVAVYTATGMTLRGANFRVYRRCGRGTASHKQPGGTCKGEFGGDARDLSCRRMGDAVHGTDRVP